MGQLLKRTWWQLNLVMQSTNCTVFKMKIWLRNVLIDAAPSMDRDILNNTFTSFLWRQLQYTWISWTTHSHHSFDDFFNTPRYFEQHIHIIPLTTASTHLHILNNTFISFLWRLLQHTYISWTTHSHHSFDDCFNTPRYLEQHIRIIFSTIAQSKDPKAERRSLSGYHLTGIVHQYRTCSSI